MGGRNRQYNTIDHPSKYIVPQHFISHRWLSGRFFLQRRVRMRVRETHHSTLPIEVIVEIDDDGLVGRRGRHGKLIFIGIIIGFTVG